MQKGIKMNNVRVIKYSPSDLEKLEFYSLATRSRKSIKEKRPKEKKGNVEKAYHEFLKRRAEYLRSKEVRDIEIIIEERDPKLVTKEELEVIKQILGDPEAVSNCCSASILGTDICSDCKEHCSIIYLF